MHNIKYFPVMKISITALALLLNPLTLQAQDKSAEASMGAREKSMQMRLINKRQEPQKPRKMRQRASETQRPSPLRLIHRPHWCPLLLPGTAFMAS